MKIFFQFLNFFFIDFSLFFAIFLVMAWFNRFFSFSNLCSEQIFLYSRLTFYNPGKKVQGGGITGIQMKFAKTTDFYQFYIVLNPKIPEFFSENPNFDIVERQP